MAVATVSQILLLSSACLLLALYSAAAAHPHTQRSALASLARQQDSEGGQALDGESCKTIDDCRAPRRCLDTSSRLENIAIPCSNSSTSCFCVNHRICVSANDCDDGEGCVLDVGYPTCVSTRLIAELGLSPIRSPDADAPPPVFGFTGELCSTDEFCQGNRKCRPERRPLSEQLSCGPMFMTCSCVPEPFERCENPVVIGEDGKEVENDGPKDECSDGEKCQTVGGNPICYTAKVNAHERGEAMEKEPPVQGVFVETGAEEDVVCISTHMLTQLNQHQLLFSTPRIARVLCDANESCATAGHMVSYKGQLMMMKTYCELAACTSKLMYVNSPRFQRALRIESNTEGLSFTALAARYETRGEERLFSMAVRFGLL